MSPSQIKSFYAVLEPLQSALGWLIARIPFDVVKTWPKRKGLRVRGEISSESGKGPSAKGGKQRFAFRSSLFAFSGGEGHFLLVNKKMQSATRAKVGSMVRIRLEPDLEERQAVVPAELAQALKGDRRLRKWFDGLSYSHRKWIGDWINEPRHAANRESRAERIAERLLLTLEGETELPPILHAAFLSEPLARRGWDAMTATQRRNHLLGIFYYQSVEARELRAAKAVEEALRVARRKFPV
jgi:uncharacterized protein YdeI (YjbR/CyaY-like superfamily)